VSDPAGHEPGLLTGQETGQRPGQETGPAPAQAGEALLRLVAVMDTLRVECPWDARQTHESLAPFLVEECYEALEAIETADYAALCDELGDVLLQVLFNARVASERTDGTGFTIDDVAAGTVAKLVRRHPHVFGDVSVSDADEVKRNWDAIKAAERATAGREQGSSMDSVPFGQPALALAAQLQRRAARAGAPEALTTLTVTTTAPEAPTTRPPAHGGADAQPPVSEVGAELFALVAKARRAGLDPELELRSAARAYAARVRAWEHPNPT
jgi:XTP/dITP diphosphohydrolase